MVILANILRDVKKYGHVKKHYAFVIGYLLLINMLIVAFQFHYGLNIVFSFMIIIAIVIHLSSVHKRIRRLEKKAEENVGKYLSLIKYNDLHKQFNKKGEQ